MRRRASSSSSTSCSRSAACVDACEQLAQVGADGVHQLDDRGVALALVAAQHLHEPDARPVVTDRERVGALQPVLDQRVGHEAPVRHEVGHPQGLAVLHDPTGEAVASTRRVGRLLPREGRRDARRACPHVPAHQLLVRREGPERRHVPVETAPERREEPLGRRLADRRVGQDLEQLARELRPALQLALVAGAEDADDDAAGEWMVEDADDKLGVDVRAVGAFDDGGQPAPDELFGLGAHERVEVVAHQGREGLGHEVDDGPPDEGPVGPAQELLGRRVDVADLAALVGGHHGVAQTVEHRAHAGDGPAGLGPSRRRARARAPSPRRRWLRRAGPATTCSSAYVPGAMSLAACERQRQREPHRLARTVVAHLDAPGLGQRSHDGQPATVRRVGGRLLQRRVAGRAVAHVDADAGRNRGTPVPTPRTRSPHAAPRWWPARRASAPARRCAPRTPPGRRPSRKRRAWPTEAAVAGNRRVATRAVAATARVWAVGCSPGGIGPRIPVAVALPRRRNP